MKNLVAIVIIALCLVIMSCKAKRYKSNGEKIYKTGRNLNDDRLLDRKASSIKFVNSCITCHGKNGDRMNGVSIKFRDLSNPNKYAIPYNDTLFFRFLDHDLKSEGSKANIGVNWKMNIQDKKDLLEYLKKL